MKTSDKVLLKILGLFFIGGFNSITKSSNTPLVIMLSVAFSILGLIIMVSLVVDAVRAFKNRKQRRREQEN